MNIHQNITTILKEIKNVLSSVNEKDARLFAEQILEANKIVIAGAGRMGLASRAFSMRLAHLGFASYFIGDSNVPSVGKGDLVIIASGSGETQTIYDIAKIAKKDKANVVLISANPKSRIGRIASKIVKIEAPTKVNKKIKSIQPMTTLNEQSIGIFYDALVLMIMSLKNESHETMWSRHSNLE